MNTGCVIVGSASTVSIANPSSTLNRPSASSGDNGPSAAQAIELETNSPTRIASNVRHNLVLVMEPLLMRAVRASSSIIHAIIQVLEPRSPNSLIDYDEPHPSGFAHPFSNAAQKTDRTPALL